jgi:hypothetical protein
MKAKQLLIGMAVALCLTSCASKMLYSWGNYDDTSYKYLKNSDEKSIDQLMETYRQLVEKQEGTRQIVPPGIYADYGFILLQANRTEEGRAMLEKEITLYPESKIFIAHILKMFEQ